MSSSWLSIGCIVAPDHAVVNSVCFATPWYRWVVLLYTWLLVVCQVYFILPCTSSFHPCLCYLCYCSSERAWGVFSVGPSRRWSCQRVFKVAVQKSGFHMEPSAVPICEATIANSKVQKLLSGLAVLVNPCALSLLARFQVLCCRPCVLSSGSSVEVTQKPLYDRPDKRKTRRRMAR